MKHVLTALGILFASLFLSGCALQKGTEIFNPPDLNAEVKAGGVGRKVDAFLVVFDASSSMFENYKGAKKLDIAKTTLSRLNQAIPDLKLQGGMQVFGPTVKPYGVTMYTKEALQEAIDRVTGTLGASNLDASLDRATEKLSGVSGKIAVIVISDGADMDDTPVRAAERMKAHIGDRLCIHAVHIGDLPPGRDILEKIVSAGGCGIMATGDELASGEGMASFASKIFLEKGEDSDLDGVLDSRDRCLGTPRGTRVDSDGCPGAPVQDTTDSDGDGVIDPLDRCPGTPAGIAVTRYGCPEIIIESASLLVEFDFNKANVKPSNYPDLERFARFLMKHPSGMAVIEGHTDNWGSEQYNMSLSMQRADNVKRYLIEKFGINPSQVQTKGYGFSRPKALNKTDEDRQRNRRAESIVTVEAQ